MGSRSQGGSLEQAYTTLREVQNQVRTAEIGAEGIAENGPKQPPCPTSTGATAERHARRSIEAERPEPSSESPCIWRNRAACAAPLQVRSFFNERLADFARCTTLKIALNMSMRPSKLNSQGSRGDAGARREGTNHSSEKSCDSPYRTRVLYQRRLAFIRGSKNRTRPQFSH